MSTLFTTSCLSAALLVVAALGCGPPPPSKDPLPPEIPPLPRLGVGEPEEDTFPKLPDGGPVTLSWNLEKGAHHAFDIGQAVKASALVTAQNQTREIAGGSRFEGILEILGGGGGRGSALLVLKPKERVRNGETVPERDLQEEQPARFSLILTEDGSIPSSRRASGEEDHHFMDVLFALPPGPLAPGRSAEREVHHTERYGYHGVQRIRHAGRRMVGPRACVKLVSEVDLEVTPPRATRGMGRLVGRVTAYFDPEGRTFTRAEADLVLVIHELALIRPSEPDRDAYWNLGRLTIDTRIHARRKGD